MLVRAFVAVVGESVLLEPLLQLWEIRIVGTLWEKCGRLVGEVMIYRVVMSECLVGGSDLR